MRRDKEQKGLGKKQGKGSGGGETEEKRERRMKGEESLRLRGDERTEGCRRKLRRRKECKRR